MTPRKSVGWVKDSAGDEWEVLFWQVKNKLSAAQFLIRADLSVGRKIFFSTEEEARAWLANPILPTLEEIKKELAKCEWHEPSKGLIQVWMDFWREEE
ncbi:MAG TPA: hypothetical protein PLK35_03765 [Candidatus Moranbacteria bacterium]|nr:hypothetical protein [Candidatus Moranbacteria bacterium]